MANGSSTSSAALTQSTVYKMKTCISLLIIGLWFTLGAQAGDKKKSNKPARGLVVSFQSACCGPDQDAIARVDHEIAEIERGHRVKLTYRKVYWGKEGEFDYCFDLAKVSKEVRRELVSNIKRQVLGVGLVSVRENAVCQKGRQS
jgi:hypothetical protein